MWVMEGNRASALALFAWSVFLVWIFEWRADVVYLFAAARQRVSLPLILRAERSVYRRFALR